MKLEDMQHLLGHIDGLSNYDFDLFLSVMLIRSLGREHPRRSPPKSPPGGELEDCDPGTKRQGAAPKSL